MKWDLTKIFKTKKDFEKMKEELLKNLDKIESYQGKLCDSANNLYNCYKIDEIALEQYEKLYSYGMLNYHLDMSNQENIKLFKEVENLGAIFSTKVSFISPEITYADENKIRGFIENSKELLPYKRDILDILDKKKHTLDKTSENILSNYDEVFGAPENTFDILTNAEFKFGKIVDEEGEKVELTKSNYSIYMKSQKEEVRKQAFKQMYLKYSEFINTITELYLTNVKTSTITAKLRNYASSLEKAVINDDASVKVYDSLLNSINKNIKVNHEFIDLKKKLLNKDKLYMYDLYVNPFEEEKDEISFEEAKKEVLDALDILGEEYKEMLNTSFRDNWIDLEAKPNKRGGAYSMGVYGVHPFVLTNFMNSKRDVSTIAHELGHAMHSYYSNSNQNIINANYTIMVAEVASTVNELLLSNYQIKNEKDNKKKAMLIYELLEMIRATFFRQSMFAEFEKEVHGKIESLNFLSAEDLNNIYYDLNKKYFGNNMEVNEEIKYEWARIPHFYSNFYVYKYATGISAAICIVDNILKQGTTYVNRYIEMLKQGCSKKSIDLLKMVDVDLESEFTYNNTIKFYKEKIEELKKLI